MTKTTEIIQTTCPRCQKLVKSYDVSYGWEEPAVPDKDPTNIVCFHFSCECGLTWAQQE
jgi:hypothetical protein